MTTSFDVLQALDDMLTKGRNDAAVVSTRAAVAEMIETLKVVQRTNNEAMPKFNWGASALDANAIGLLNQCFLMVDSVLARYGGDKT